MEANTSQIAAFFDMDRTVVLCNTGQVYFNDLRQRGQLNTRQVVKLLSVLLRYKFSVIDMARVMEDAAKQIAGEPEQDMIDRCQALFEEQVAPLVSDAAVEAIEGHRKQGHRVVLLSASTQYMVGPLSRHLEFDEFICTRLNTDRGRFTGGLDQPICFGEGKIHWARAYAQARDIDMAQSYFYTDSYSDLPMLEVVGHKRVVNPDPRLRLHAALHRWPVLTFYR